MLMCDFNYLELTSVEQVHNSVMLDATSFRFEKALVAPLAEHLLKQFLSAFNNVLLRT